MSDDPNSPQLPMIPDIGDILDRKDRMVEKVTTMLKCKNCKVKYSRTFIPGDYTFKKLTEEKCKECEKVNVLIIEEIYSEFIDPKKSKNKTKES